MLTVFVCRDLWELRAEFSRLSSTLLSNCDSVYSTMSLATLHKSSALLPPPPSSPPPLSSTMILPPLPPLPPPDSCSTQGSFSIGELEVKEEEKLHEKTEALQQRWAFILKIAEVLTLLLLHLLSLPLSVRTVELARSLQDEREEKERVMERHQETTRRLQSVSQAVIRLVSVIGLKNPAPHWYSISENFNYKWASIQSKHLHRKKWALDVDMNTK